MTIAEVSGKSIAELMSLTGRVAVVTGGAQGLGRAMVNRLAEAGASVLILDLKADQAEAAAREVSEVTGARVIAASVDVTDTPSVVAAADRAVTELGGAGMQRGGPLAAFGDAVAIAATIAGGAAWPGLPEITAAGAQDLALLRVVGP